MSRFIKYPYQALHVNNRDYDNYLLLKSYCQYSKKSGIVRKGELIRIASKVGINSKTLYRLFKHFVDLSWIVPTVEGHRLININQINANLNFKPYTHKREGFTLYPFFKVTIDNIKHLDEIKMYHLILETSSRYNYHLPANTNADNYAFHKKVKSKKKTQVENDFMVSLEKIKNKGGYKSKTQVDKIITKAIKLGLINRYKHGINHNTGKFNCNTYTFSDYQFEEPLSISKVKDVQIKKKTVPRTKTVYNPIELKFKDFVDTYLIELIENGFLDKKYYTRKLSIRSYSKLLKRLLVSDSYLKDILMGYINPADIEVRRKLIELNNFNMGYVNTLPKYYGDKEYGIEYKFYLGISDLNNEVLTKTVNKINEARGNYYAGTTVTKTVNPIVTAQQSLNEFRLQLMNNCI